MITLKVINQFLPNDKLELNDELDPITGEPVDWPLVEELVTTASDVIVSKLGVRFNTSTWFVVETPSIVRNIAGMLVAGWVYNRQFSEEAIESSSYGNALIEHAYKLLDSALGGTLVIDGATLATSTSTQSASFEATEPAFLIDERF